MIEIGRLCMKIAGRDAGKYGIIIDIINDKFVMLDGQVRRRKVNINHVELLPKVLNIKRNANHEEVINALKSVGIIVEEKQDKKKTEKNSEKENLGEKNQQNKEKKSSKKKIIK
ncbi:MAG: 50S ribosomal protein L14e [Candidatus Woesearchaeota archaeon]